MMQSQLKDSSLGITLPILDGCESSFDFYLIFFLPHRQAHKSQKTKILHLTYLFFQWDLEFLSQQHGT